MIPVSSFTLSSQNVSRGVTVTSENNSENADSYIWEVNNEEFSIDENIEIDTTEWEPGIYVIILKAVNGEGSDVFGLSLKVSEPPVSGQNISNVLFEFTSELVTAAADETPLKDVVIHPDIYEEIRPGKTIRIDSLRTSDPVLIGSGQIREDNAVLYTFFLKMPESQAVSDRLAARQTTQDMVEVWLQAFYNDPKLTDSEGNPRVCNVGQVKKQDGWIKPGSVKIPVSILKLLINPR
jgi:hypothetical protein